MIEQTVSFTALTAGMARCVREWILPHLTDPMARLEAEQLAELLETLPQSFGDAAREAIRTDTEETRAVLARLGECAPAATADSIDALMAANARMKARLLAIADALRRDGSADAQRRLAELQQFFLRSLTRELGAAAATEDFVSMTSKDSQARNE